MLAHAISSTSATTTMMVTQRPLIAPAQRRVAGRRGHERERLLQVSVESFGVQSGGSVASRICGCTPRSAAVAASIDCPLQPRP